MKVITTHLSPTSSPKTAFRALEVLFPSGKNGNIALQKLIDRLKEITKTRHVILFSSGRSALFYSFKALGIGPGDEVIIQSFTCSVVPASVLQNGATPVYVDINRNTLNISEHQLKNQIGPKTKAIVFQHTFGNSDGLGAVFGIAKQRGIKLIEDRAHILDELPLLGDVAILSFGRSKWASSIFGGAVITNSLPISSKLKKINKGLPPPSFFWLIHQLLQPIIMETLIKPFLGIFKIGESIQFIFGLLGITSKEVTQEEKQGKLSKLITHSFHSSLSRLLVSQLESYPDLTSRRITTIRTYQKSLPRAILLQGFKKSEPYLYYPIIVPDSQLLYECCKKVGIYLGNWYYPAVSPPGTDNNAISYHPKSFPVAEDISRHIVNLPTLIDSIDATRVVHTISSCLS